MKKLITLVVIASGTVAWGVLHKQLKNKKGVENNSKNYDDFCNGGASLTENEVYSNINKDSDTNIDSIDSSSYDYLINKRENDFFQVDENIENKNNNEDQIIKYQSLSDERESENESSTEDYAHTEIFNKIMRDLNLSNGVDSTSSEDKDAKGDEQKDLEANNEIFLKVKPISTIDNSDNDEIIDQSKSNNYNNDIFSSEDAEELTDSIEKQISKIRDSQSSKLSEDITFSKKSDTEYTSQKINFAGNITTKEDIIAKYSMDYPYITTKFIKDILDLRDKFSMEYVEGTFVSIEHNVKFENLDNIFSAIQLIKENKDKVYETSDENIVTLSKIVKVKEDAIIKNIFNVANQVSGLNGEYIRFRIIKRQA